MWMVVINLPPPRRENSSMGFRKGEYEGRNSTDILGCAANQSVTATGKGSFLPSSPPLAQVDYAGHPDNN